MDYDKIIDRVASTSLAGEWREHEIKRCMKTACQKVLDKAIKSFPSHEHLEIAKSILALKNEL